MEKFELIFGGKSVFGILINMTTNIDMRLASARQSTTLFTENAMPRLYTPGEVVTSQQGFMR